MPDTLIAVIIVGLRRGRRGKNPNSGNNGPTSRRGSPLIKSTYDTHTHAPTHCAPASMTVKPFRGYISLFKAARWARWREKKKERTTIFREKKTLDTLINNLDSRLGSHLYLATVCNFLNCLAKSQFDEVSSTSGPNRGRDE